MGVVVDIRVRESTWRAGEGRFLGERISEEKVKGRREAVVVYSLKGRAPPEHKLPSPSGRGTG
jgi:adenylate cyclase